jgi:hypothetical protein
MWPLTRLRTRLRFYNVDGGPVLGALLQEDESFLLQEDNEYILLDG